MTKRKRKVPTPDFEEMASNLLEKKLKDPIFSWCRRYKRGYEYIYKDVLKRERSVLESMRYGFGEEKPKYVKNYRGLEEVGEGAFATVYRAEILDSNSSTVDVVAALKVSKDYSEEGSTGSRQVTDGVPYDMLRELDCLTRLKHPNLIGLLGVNFEGDVFSIFLEYAPSDLDDYIRRDGFLRTFRGDRSMGKRSLPFMIQLLRGLSYIHSMGYMHRDIKPENLLITKYNALKIGDFGSVKTIGGNVTPYEVTSLNYRAPEILVGKWDYDEGIDVWSAACVFFEMMTTEKLFHTQYIHTEIAQLGEIFDKLGTPKADSPLMEKDRTHIFREKKKKKNGKVFRGVDERYFRILEGMLSYDERKSSKEALEFFEKVYAKSSKDFKEEEERKLKLKK